MYFQQKLSYPKNKALLPANPVEFADEMQQKNNNIRNLKLK